MGFENLFWSLRINQVYWLTLNWSWCSFNKSWGIATCKGIQDSVRFRIPRNRFRIPGTAFRILSQWNLDSGFQSLEGFRILWDTYSVFQSLGFGFYKKNLLDPGFYKPKFPWFRNLESPLLGREVTLSGNLRTKQEYILYSKLSSTIWTLYRKIF